MVVGYVCGFTGLSSWWFGVVWVRGLGVVYGGFRH